MTTVAHAIVSRLEDHGVALMVGQSLPSALFLAAEETGIRQLHVRTENAGTAICDAYARISGRIAVIGAQNGPAATLLVPGLAEAMKTSTPVLAIVQEVDLPHREKNAFQELDHLALFASCAKWVGRIDDAGRARDYVDIALNNAVSGRPGSVVLLVPAGLLMAEAAGSVARPIQPLASFPADRPVAAHENVTAAADMLANAEFPLIVAGGGCRSSHAEPELQQLMTEHAFPVGTTLMGKGVVDETEPLSLGVIGYLLGKAAPNRDVRDYVQNADVILFVGARTNQNGTDSWTLFPEGARFIHLDVDGVEIGRNYPSLRLVGDAKATLRSLLAVLEDRPDSGAAGRQDRLPALIPNRRSLAECGVRETGKGVRPEQIVEDMLHHATSDTIFVADASYSSAWLCAYGLAKEPSQRFITPRGLAGLGWGFPMGIGSAIACPGQRVVVLSGDGGFAHVWGELETAVRYGLPVINVILNNGVLGYQRDAELVKFGRHTAAIPIGAIDHAAIARAVGCNGRTAGSIEAFRSQFREALDHDGPTLIDVTTDPAAFPPVTLLDALVTDGVAA